jgi:hypothetical protein
MAAQEEGFYREVVRAGYRSPSLLRLAEIVAGGEIGFGVQASSGTTSSAESDFAASLLRAAKVRTRAISSGVAVPVAACV